MSTTQIIYDAAGTPTNLPPCELVLLYGMDGLDACGPVLGQWDTSLGCWSDDRYGKFDWYPVFFSVPPANPCKSVSEPTVGNEVV